jgi:hypothetical protein
MQANQTAPLNAPLLWGDFRVFLAGREPTEELVEAFAQRIDGAEGGKPYGLPASGCGHAIVAELTKRLSD